MTKNEKTTPEVNNFRNTDQLVRQETLRGAVDKIKENFFIISPRGLKISVQ